MRPSSSAGLLAAFVALGVLAAVSVAHPELRLVDVVAFSGRAERLVAGTAGAEDLLSPRYPVGYPALLGVVKGALGDVRLAGRVLSVGAGVLAATAAARWLGLLPALVLLAQAPMLDWAAAEGTDLPALALVLVALATVQAPRDHRRAVAAPLLAAAVAGAAVGAAAMMRYPAVTAAPVVLAAAVWASPRRGAAALSWAAGFLVATGPHWGLALMGVGSLLPDASENAAIGASSGAGLTVAAWAQACGRAVSTALSAWPTWLGVAGLAVGVGRRDARAIALLAVGLLQVVLLGFFFANPRLCLPLTAVSALGVAFVPLPRRWLEAGALLGAVLLLLVSVRHARESDAATAARIEWNLAVLGEPGPLAATSPWVHLHRTDGWLEPAVLIKEAGPALQLRPEALVAWARREGVVRLMLDNGRVQRSYPGLRPLMQGPVDGLSLVERGQGWRLYAVLPAADAPPPADPPPPPADPSPPPADVPLPPADPPPPPAPGSSP